MQYVNIVGLNFFACSIKSGPSSANDTINGIKALYVSTFELQLAGNNLAVQSWNIQLFDMDNTGIVICGNNMTLENSEIAYSAGNGVLLDGVHTSFLYGNVVENNVIHDTDYMGVNGALICNGPGWSTPTSTFNTIEYNTIYNTGREGIDIGNMGSGVVEHNNIYDCMLQTVDEGGIYTFQQNGQASTPSGPGPDTVIAYNTVHDIESLYNIGIYLDNGSTNYVVAFNLVYNTYSAMTLNPYTNYNMVYNNTLIGTLGSLGVGLDTAPYMTGTYIENNLFTSGVSLGLDYAAYAYNLPDTTDPGFVNAAALNFQLLPNSAAVGAGTIIPGLSGNAPGSSQDVGCFPYGANPWTAGANVMAANAYAAAIPATPVNLTATPTQSTPWSVNLAWNNTGANATSCVVEWAANLFESLDTPLPGSTSSPTWLPTTYPVWTPVAYLPGNAASYTDYTTAQRLLPRLHLRRDVRRQLRRQPRNLHLHRDLPFGLLQLRLHRQRGPRHPRTRSRRTTPRQTPK